MRMRKEEREARRAEVVKAIHDNPGITRLQLYMRFPNLSETFIQNTIRNLGLKVGKPVAARDTKHLRIPKERCRSWGWTGYVQEVK